VIQTRNFLHLWIPAVNYRIYERPPLVPILRQMGLLQTPPSYFFKVPSSVHLDIKALYSFQALRINLFVEFRVSHECHIASCMKWWCYRVQSCS